MPLQTGPRSFHEELYFNIIFPSKSYENVLRENSIFINNVICLVAWR